jgi:tetratricopeptide (TPR) repeat protein
MKTQKKDAANAAPCWFALVPVRPFAICCCLAAVLALSSGCLATPRQPAGNTIPPAVPQSATGTSPAELSKLADPKAEFHATATDRQRFGVHLDFGRIFESKGEFDAAVLEYQEALAVVQNGRRGELKAVDEALAHRRMGGALDRLGRFAQAEVHYKKALRLASNDPRVWNDLGYSYYLQSRWADAERALRKAVKLAPEDERVRTNLGLVLAAGGRPQEAFPLLSQSNGDAIGHANLGYLLASTGQLALARQQYEQALAQRPDLTLARRALAQIDRQQQAMASLSTMPQRLATGGAPPAPPVDPSVDRASTPKPGTSRPIIPPPRPPTLKPTDAAAKATLGAATDSTPAGPVIPLPKTSFLPAPGPAQQ